MSHNDSRHFVVIQLRGALDALEMALRDAPAEDEGHAARLAAAVECISSAAAELAGCARHATH